MDEQVLNKIADFILKYAPQYKNKEKIKEYIKLHFDYKTAFVMFDSLNEVIGVCRWNIEGDNAHILDMYLREDFRRKRIIQQMLYRGLQVFPYVKTISFERDIKYPARKISKIPVSRILKRR